MNREHIPYNTGKVKIGQMYTPRQQQQIDPGMGRVQAALIPPSQRLIEADRKEWRGVILDALLTSAAVVMLLAIVFSPRIWELFSN